MSQGFIASPAPWRRGCKVPRSAQRLVASIQTFGSYGNRHPHVHALITDGLIERGGAHLPLAMIEARACSRSASGASSCGGSTKPRDCPKTRSSAYWPGSIRAFSVHVGDVIEPTHRESLERLGRYVARAPIALSKVHVQGDGRVRLRTPPDPQTRKESRIFDPLAWVHAVTTQIPDPYQHLVRYYGAYSCRARRLYRPAETEVEEDVVPKPNRDGASRAQDEATATCRRSWARLLRRIYEVDPLTSSSLQPPVEGGGRHHRSGGRGPHPGPPPAQADAQSLREPGAACARGHLTHRSRPAAAQRAAKGAQGAMRACGAEEGVHAAARHPQEARWGGQGPETGRARFGKPRGQLDERPRPAGKALRPLRCPRTRG